MSLADFIYYTILKHGKIIIIALGIFLFLFVTIYFQRFGLAYKETTESSLRFCEVDEDCFFHCGKCYSIKPSDFCEKNYTEEKECICIDNVCQIA